MLLSGKLKIGQIKGRFISLLIFTFVMRGFAMYGQYCTPQTSDTINFITSFNFDSLNYTASYYSAASGYTYTNAALKPPILLSKTYPFQASANKNGGFAVWIDFDGDGVFNDSNEFVFVSNDTSKNQYAGNIIIPARAKQGKTRLRIRTSYDNIIGPAQSCTNLIYSETRDYDVIISDSGNMDVNAYEAVYFNDSAFAGQNNAKILKINLSTSGSKNPLEVNGFYFSDSVMNLGDVTNAKLFYTGYIPLDSLPLSMLDTLSAPVSISGKSFFIPVHTQLSTGDNYFWLTYNIGQNTNMGDYLSGVIDSVAIGSGTGLFLHPAYPTGRKIVPHYDYQPINVLYPNSIQNRMIGITMFNFGGINNITTDDNKLDYFDSLTANVYVNQAFPLSIEYGKGYNEQIGGWVDWNNDGYFDNETERFFFRPNAQAANTYDTIISIPCNVKSGTYKMRIMSDGSGAPALNINNNLYYGDAREYYIRILNDTHPYAHFIKDSVYFTGSPGIMKNNSMATGNIIYQWDYNNNGRYDTTAGDGSYTFNSVGKYRICLKITLFACDTTYIDSFSDTIRVIAAPAVPVSNFAADTTTGSVGQQIQFTDLSSNGPLYWQWQISPEVLNGAPTYYFADSTNANSENPVIIFTQTGRYTIGLAAGNAIGTGNTLRMNNYINIIQTMDMCSGVDTVNSSSGYLYDDGGPFKPYGNNKNCHLLIQSKCNLPITLSFFAFDVSIYNLAWNGSLAGDYLRIYDGADTTGTPLHEKAGFPLGFQNRYPANLPPHIPTLTANSGSMYIVWHTDSSFVGDGFAAKWDMLSTNAPVTIASFTAPDTVWQYQPVSFVNISQGSYLAFAWDTNGSGNYVLNDTNLEKQFLMPGLYTIGLFASGCGGVSYFTKSIYVKLVTKAPKAGFSANYTRAGVGDNISFNDLTSNGPSAWDWDIMPSAPNDSFSYTAGTGPNSQDPIISFGDTGLYSVGLKVKNIIGKDSAIKNDYIRIYAYCQPSAQNVKKDIDLSNLIVAGPSGSRVVNSRIPFDTSAYQHIQLPTTPILYSKESYSFNFERNIGADTMNGKVWIDYDGDGIFNDSNELVTNQPDISGSQWGNTVLVPSKCINGITRMRIGVSAHNTQLVSCGNIYEGKFYDFTVALMPNTIKPVIQLKGKDTVVQEIPLPYSDAGATAFDSIEGNLTQFIDASGYVNVSQIGNYTITYNVVDKAGNAAIPVIRHIKIINDTTRPIIFIVGDHHPFIDVPVLINLYPIFNFIGNRKCRRMIIIINFKGSGIRPIYVYNRGFQPLYIYISIHCSCSPAGTINRIITNRVFS